MDTVRSETPASIFMTEATIRVDFNLTKSGRRLSVKNRLNWMAEIRTRRAITKSSHTSLKKMVLTVRFASQT